MNVAWTLCSGGSRSTKPCVFPWQQPGTLCAAVAAAVVPGANRFSLGVLQCVVVHVCVGSYRVFWNSVADRSGMAA